MEALENAMDKINEIKDNLSGLFKTEILDSVKQYGLDKLNDTFSIQQLFFSAPDTVSPISR
jgi:hypothetical protein